MTTEESTTIDENQTEHFSSPGELLKEAREELNLTIKQVAERLCLRNEVVRQIENDQFDMDKLATFTRGYYRSYAKVVNIPEATIINALDSLGKVKIEEHDMQSFSRKTKKQKHDSRIMKLTWVIFAMIFALSVVWWWQEQAQFEEENIDFAPTSEILNQQNQNIDVAQDSESEVLKAVALNEEELNRAQAYTQIESVDNKNEVLDDSIKDTAETVQIDKTVESESKIIPKESVNLKEKAIENNLDEAMDDKESGDSKIVSSEELVMTFSDDAWVQIKDASGRSLYAGIKRENETLELTGKEPYRLIIGAPTVVSLYYKGQRIDLSNFPVGKVARLTLPQL